MEQLLEKFAGKVSSLADYTVKTAQRAQIARMFLREGDERSAAVLLMALRTLHRIDSFYWEPETIWLTLEREDKVDMGELGRNKLMAALTLIHNPAFFWDNLVFQRTVQAFNGEPFDPEALQECSPGYMAWAVYAARLIRGLDPEEPVEAEIDEDVQQYIAVCLKRAGFVYPPNQLTIIADNLIKLLPKENLEFVEEVKKSWEHLDKGALSEREFREDPLGVQLARLASCYEYVRERADAMANEILMLDRSITS